MAISRYAACMTDIKNTIAKAIKSADNSYFSEDYVKQASSVLRAIEKEGFVLMPKDAPSDIYAKVSDKIPSGRMRPEDLVKSIYTATVQELKVK